MRCANMVSLYKQYLSFLESESEEGQEKHEGKFDVCGIKKQIMLWKHKNGG